MDAIVCSTTTPGSSTATGPRMPNLRGPDPVPRRRGLRPSKQSRRCSTRSPAPTEDAALCVRRSLDSVRARNPPRPPGRRLGCHPGSRSPRKVIYTTLDRVAEHQLRRLAPLPSDTAGTASHPHHRRQARTRQRPGRPRATPTNSSAPPSPAGPPATTTYTENSIAFDYHHAGTFIGDPGHHDRHHQGGSQRQDGRPVESTSTVRITPSSTRPSRATPRAPATSSSTRSSREPSPVAVTTSSSRSTTTPAAGAG